MLGRQLPRRPTAVQARVFFDPQSGTRGESTGIESTIYDRGNLCISCDQGETLKKNATCRCACYGLACFKTCRYRYVAFFA